MLRLLLSQNKQLSQKQFHGCILHHLQVDSQWLISLFVNPRKKGYLLKEDGEKF